MLRQTPPPCGSLTELFYSPEEDGRNETGRREREAQCKIICLECPYRMQCLWKALVGREAFGVWGGMSEYERRSFRAHLRDEGYIDSIPHGLELQASLAAFYTEWFGEKVTAHSV